jgi:hypothetical protein
MVTIGRSGKIENCPYYFRLRILQPFAQFLSQLRFANAANAILCQNLEFAAIKFAKNSVKNFNGFFPIHKFAAGLRSNFLHGVFRRQRHNLPNQALSLSRLFSFFFAGKVQ